MATATRKTDQPWAAEAKAKPADKKVEEPKGVGVKDLADHLGTEPRLLRAFLRRTQRAVGKGTRYSWPSLNDSAVKKIAADWRKAQAAEAAAGPKEDES